MKKKMTAGLFVLLITLFSLSVQAGLFATISMKGLSFASPQTAQIVQTALTVTQYTPKAWVEGRITRQITGEAFQLIAEESKEAGQAIQQYNRVKGWIDEGAQITEDLKLTENAELAGGSITIDDEERDVSSLVSSELEEGSIEVSNMAVSSKREGEAVTFTAKKDGYVIINGIKYENLKEGSFISIGRDGSITEADITTTKAGPYEFGGMQLYAEKGARITYEDEILGVHGQGKIGLDGRETSFKGDMTCDKESCMLGKNTVAESDKFKVTTSEKEAWLFSTCQKSISGIDSYINPCKDSLTMEGAFKVQLKEGKNFGLNIEKDDNLEFDLKGGKVTINDGVAGVGLKPGASVKITNGDVVTIHKQTAKGVQTTTEPGSIGKQPDVELITATGFEEWSCATETNKEGIKTYHCPIETSQITAKAITDITGMDILDKCTKIVDSGKGAVEGKIQDYRERFGPKEVEIVTGVSISKNTEGVTVNEYESGEKHILYKRIDEKGNLQTYRVYTVGDRGLVWLKTEGEEEPDIYEEGITSYERAERLTKRKFGEFQGYINPKKAKTLGLEVKKIEAYAPSEKELNSITPPSGDIMIYDSGVWYMENGEVWQMQLDRVTVECVNCETKRVYKGR